MHEDKMLWDSLNPIYLTELLHKLEEVVLGFPSISKSNW